MNRFAIALLFVVACKKEEKPAAPPPTPPPDPQVTIDAAPAVSVDADMVDAVSPDDAGVLDALSSKATSTCAPTECYMPAEKACYVPDPSNGICGNAGPVCRRCKPRQ